MNWREVYISLLPLEPPSHLPPPSHPSGKNHEILSFDGKEILQSKSLEKYHFHSHISPTLLLVF